jgi:7,8-dihydroneopterin aldolase/epimerase/oxygenase
MRVEPGQWLHVEGVGLQCTIGVTEKERRAKQRIVINLQLEMDFGEVGRSDSIDDTVDYRVVTRRTIEVAEKSSFRLIETLADHLCRTILAEFPRIHGVRLEVWKPGALTAAKSVGAVVSSVRSNY